MRSDLLPIPELPNLLYLGADKAGSTSIASMLNDHPNVHVTPAKDTYFFTSEYERGLDWYRRQFSPLPHHDLVAEVCHDYLYDADAPYRVADDLGLDVTLLICLRDPIDRAVSSWLHRRKHGYRGGFVDAATAFPDILEHGDYGTHLARWYDTFSPETFVIMLFDDLAANPAGFADRLYGRLALPPHSVSQHALAPRLAAADPRSDVAATVVKGAAKAVRRLGGPTLIGRVKSSRSVQRLLYRPLEATPEIPQAAVEAMEQRYGPEIDVASRLTSIDLLASWPRYQATDRGSGSTESGAAGVS
jgi:hypothetical protein